MLNCHHKLRVLTLLGAILVLVSASGATSLAEETGASPTSTPAPTASAAPTAAEAPATPASAAPAAVAAPAASPTPSAPTPTLEQRGAGLEAYVTNGDPTASLKDKQGNIPKDLTMATVGTPGPGHNAWMMTSAALVLFMTLPGLALFYGGLVRRKNVLSVLAQCFGIAGLVSILWWLCGYSMAFHSGNGSSAPFLGALDWKFLTGVDSNPNTDYGAWVSHNVYSMYQ